MFPACRTTPKSIVCRRSGCQRRTLVPMLSSIAECLAAAESSSSAMSAVAPSPAAEAMLPALSLSSQSAVTVTAVQLTPPTGCTAISSASAPASFAGGFFCNSTDVSLGLFDSSFQGCSIVRYKCFAPVGGVSCYIFPNSSEASTWARFSSLTPEAARAEALGGCSRSAACNLVYVPTGRISNTVLQSMYQASSQPPSAANVTFAAGKFALRTPICT